MCPLLLIFGGLSARSYSFLLISVGSCVLFSVSPEGRISANDLGMWSDKHTDGFKPLVDVIVAGGTVPGIQVSHAQTLQRTPQLCTVFVLSLSDSGCFLISLSGCGIHFITSTSCEEVSVRVFILVVIVLPTVN